MSAKLVIALTGAKGAGKDTVANLMKEMYPQINVSSVAFADPIKTKIMKIFNLRSVEEYDLLKRSDVHWGEKFTLVPGRHVCREIGMLMRSYSDTQFNDYVADFINKQEGGVVVVTDMRFDNEYTLMRDLGAAIVKVKNERVSEEDMHITERGFDDGLVDYVIPNHGTYDELRSAIGTMMEKV